MWKGKLFLKSLELSVAISSFIGVILSFVVFPTEYWWIGLIAFLSFFILSLFMIYVISINVKHHKISGRSSLYIEAMYGDILNVKQKKEKPVIVIPVNSSFDYLVEDDLSIKDRIVEGTSIHGQWIKKIAPDEFALKQLEKDIKLGIKSRCLKPDHIFSNKRGNKEIYPLGSYIFIERDDCSYLLFALTEFNEHNKVIKRDAETYVDLMAMLMNATDYCAGRHVYIPIMGTKIALFGLNTIQAFEYIKNAALNKKNSLRVSITIVIYDGDRGKVSIYD